MIYYNCITNSEYTDSELQSSESIYSAEDKLGFNKLSDKKKIEKKVVELSVLKVLKKITQLQNNKYQLKKYKSGKPYLIDSLKNKIFLSYSHSDKSVVSAVSLETDIGVDIESKARFLKHKAHQKWLHIDEYEKYKKGDLSEGDLSLIWTRKESLTKLSGLGYKLNFKDYNVYSKDKISFNEKTVIFKTEDIEDETLSFAFYEKNNDTKVISVK